MTTYRINHKPTPRVPEAPQAGSLAGRPILRVRVVDASCVHVVTPVGVVAGKPEDVLPYELQRTLGGVIKGTKTLGPTVKKVEDYGEREDETYDNESAAPPDQKPADPQTGMHPKERATLQTFHSLPDTEDQRAVIDEFPGELPSKHPKEQALEQKIQEGVKRDPQIAKTLLQQLGGANRLKAMLGAKHFVDIGNGLSFQFPNPKRNRGNAVNITLDEGSDTYNMEFGKIVKYDYKKLKEYNGVYADQLKKIFEQFTGLRMSL